MEDLYEYPVTDRYNKHKIGHQGRRKPRDVTFYDNPHTDTGDMGENEEI